MSKEEIFKKHGEILTEYGFRFDDIIHKSMEEYAQLVAIDFLDWTGRYPPEVTKELYLQYKQEKLKEQ